MTINSPLEMISGTCSRLREDIAWSEVLVITLPGLVPESQQQERGAQQRALAPLRESALVIALADPGYERG